MHTIISVTTPDQSDWLTGRIVEVLNECGIEAKEVDGRIQGYSLQAYAEMAQRRLRNFQGVRVALFPQEVST